MPHSPNIVLLVFDTMRRDAIGAYGGVASTPNFDSFCRESAVFQNCLSPSPWTLPAHVSLFTGRYPSEHGVHETREKKVLDLLGMPAGVSAKMLAESLKERGYQTVGFPANPMLTAKPGFDRGFDSFASNVKRVVSREDAALLREAVEEGRSKPALVWKYARRAEFAKLYRLYSTQRRIRNFRRSFDYPRGKGGNVLLEAMAKTRLEPPFFLFANFMETHDPYVDYELSVGNRGPFPSVGAAELYGYKAIADDAMRLIREGYQASATRVDSCFGRLVALLKEKGVYDDTIVVATSDHGQELKERGYYGHGTFLHGEILAVPLIVRVPGGHRANFSGASSLVDVPSYILKAVEGDPDPSALSKEFALSESFGTQHHAPASVGPDLAERIAEVRGRVDRPLKSVTRGAFTLVVDGATGDVEEFTEGGTPADPKEHSSEVEAMRSELALLREAPLEEAPGSVPLTPEEETSISERLRELGYL